MVHTVKYKDSLQYAVLHFKLWQGVLNLTNMEVRILSALFHLYDRNLQKGVDEQEAYMLLWSSSLRNTLLELADTTPQVLANSVASLKKKKVLTSDRKITPHLLPASNPEKRRLHFNFQPHDKHE